MGRGGGREPLPELPEVETVARQLAPCIVGRRVERLVVLDRLLRDGRGRWPQVTGRAIVEVRRSGKRVLIGFSARRAGGAPLWLAVHLRMTGRLLWVERRERQVREHLRARMRLDCGELLFIDPRRFGTFDWHPSAEAAEPAGVDPLSPALTPARLDELLGASAQSLKAWLLRQDRLVGLGNIYASEILHAARLSPFRGAGALTPPERGRLAVATRRILLRAIANCGTTFSDFQDARGREGAYQHLLAVYDREGEPCPRCRARIARTVQQQRSTFYCARCQR